MLLACSSDHTCGIKGIDHDGPSGTVCIAIGGKKTCFSLCFLCPKITHVTGATEIIKNHMGINSRTLKSHQLIYQLKTYYPQDISNCVQLSFLGSQESAGSIESRVPVSHCQSCLPGAPSVFRSTFGCCRASSEGESVCGSDIMTSRVFSVQIV